MKRLNKILISYLLLALPFHLLFIAGGVMKNSGGAFWTGKAASLITEVLSWNFIFWFCALIFVIAEIVFNESFRGEVSGAAARLAGVRERDERESMAVDRAARGAYISTLSLLVVMLFFLSLHVNAGHLPPDKAVKGKDKFITIGFGFSLTDNAQKDGQPGPGDIFSTDSLPRLSAWSLLAIVAGWHLLGFMFYLRRNNKYI